MPRTIDALLIPLLVGTLGSAVLTGCNRTGADGEARRTPVAVATPHKRAMSEPASAAVTPGTRSAAPAASPTAPVKGQTRGSDLTWFQRMAAHQKRLLAGLTKRGVTEKTEQRIYWEEAALEDRAKSEAKRAERAGPSEARREHALEEKYRRQLLLRYRSSGLSQEELRAILWHGDEEKWPAPGPAGTGDKGHPG
jgi:hypothetical protein